MMKEFTGAARVLDGIAKIEIGLRAGKIVDSDGQRRLRERRRTDEH
jgi:hypothetical protein